MVIRSKRLMKNDSWAPHFFALLCALSFIKQCLVINRAFELSNSDRFNSSSNFRRLKEEASWFYCELERWKFQPVVFDL